MYELSLRDPDFFWGQLGASRLDWISNFHTVRNSNVKSGKHDWFIGGQLNVSGTMFYIKEIFLRVSKIYLTEEALKTHCYNVEMGYFCQSFNKH